MRFALSEEHTALAATAARWAESNFGPARLRQVAAGEPADIADALAELARFGWLGIVVPEEHGGSGGTLLDGCLIAEQLTRHLAPVPFAGDALVAATAMALLGQPGQRPVALSDLAEGSRVFSLVLDERLCWPPGVGERRAYEWVPGAWLLVPEGPELVATRQLSADPLPCEDLLRSVARVPAGTTGSPPPPDSAQRLLATAHVALAACLVGAMTGAMATALAHVASREQFGRTIGSFQAVQHLCADMLVDVESSRTATYGAAWAVDNRPAADALVAAATAKAWATSAARRVCETALQLHGGMGYTWECDVHLYLRTALLLGEAFGGEQGALDTVADGLFAEASPTVVGG